MGSESTVVARVLNGDRLECQIVTPHEKTLSLTGKLSDIEPQVEGHSELQRNRALVNNGWAYAKFTFQKVNLPTLEEQKSAEKHSKAHREIAEWIADLADAITTETTPGWCSACFADAAHHRVTRPVGQLPAYLCGNCGSPSLPCAGPGCKNMAVRGRGAIRVPQYCAEHQHKIPGFAKANDKIDSPTDYMEFLKHEKANLSRTTRLLGLGVVGVAAGLPAALVAAPAIGGAVGVLIGGYSGAAATSYGLALLGGGSLAAGGLGMAGGTLVITALGGALGGALGVSVANAYVREDKSFHIEMLKGGTGVPVVVCNGFLSETGQGWAEWKSLVTTRYPDSPVYRIHWGAKELKDLGILANRAALNVAAPAAIRQAALAATKKGARRLGPLGPFLVVAELAKNPWHVARSRADKTGAIIADVLARTEGPNWVLVGHSLGARVMAVAAQALGTKTDGPRLQAVHLTGAAIDAKCDPQKLTAAVDDAMYNYHSTNDLVLKYLYSTAEGGKVAAGRKGFTPAAGKLNNVDVSTNIASHSDYYSKLNLL